MTSDQMILLRQDAKEKIKNGYMSQDHKNLLTWGALSSLLIATSLFSHSIGFSSGKEYTHEMFRISVEFKSGIHSAEQESDHYQVLSHGPPPPRIFS